MALCRAIHATKIESKKREYKRTHAHLERGQLNREESYESDEEGGCPVMPEISRLYIPSPKAIPISNSPEIPDYGTTFRRQYIFNLRTKAFPEYESLIEA